MSDNKATNTAFKARIGVQLATTMDAEASTMKSVKKKKRASKAKNHNDAPKTITLTSVGILTKKPCADGLREDVKNKHTPHCERGIEDRATSSSDIVF